MVQRLTWGATALLAGLALPNLPVEPLAAAIELAREASRQEGSSRIAAARAGDIAEPGRGADPVAAPVFGRIVIDPAGPATFSGFGTPGSRVTVVDGEGRLGEATVDPAGGWSVRTDRSLAAGDHRIGVTAQRAGNGETAVGPEVRVAIPQSFSGAPIVAYDNGEAARQRMADEQRRRAEELARVASERFSEFESGGRGERLPRLAQNDSKATQPKEPQPKAGGATEPARERPPTPGPETIVKPVTDWLERSAVEYQNEVIRKLTTIPGAPVPAQPSPPPAAKPSPEPKVVKPAEPDRAAPPVATAPAVKKPVTPPPGGDVIGGAQDWIGTASREYQKEVLKKLTVPPGAEAPKDADKTDAAKAAADAAAKADAERRIAEKKKADEAQRLADEARRREAELKRQQEDQRRAEEARKAAEARKTDDAKAISEDAARKQAEQKRLAEDQVKRAAEQKRAEDERRAAEEAQKRLAEQKRLEDQKKADDQKRGADEQARRVAEQKRAEDERRAADEQRRQAEQKRADDAKRTSEDAARRLAEQKKLDEQKRAAEEKRLADARIAEEKRLEAKRAEDARRRAEEAASRAPKAWPDTRIAEGSGTRGPVDRAPPGEPPKKVLPGADQRSSLGGAVPPERATTVRAASCRKAGKRVHPPGTYVVRRGDNLWLIAERHYRKGKRYERIVRANTGRIDDPDLIYPCQKLWLP